MDLKQLHFYLINNCHGSYPFTSCPHQIWKEYWNICEQISVYLCSCSRILSDLIRSYPSAQFTVSCKGVGWRVQGGSWSWLMSPAILQDVTCLTKHRNFYTLPPPLVTDTLLLAPPLATGWSSSIRGLWWKILNREQDKLCLFVTLSHLNFKPRLWLFLFSVILWLVFFSVNFHGFYSQEGAWQSFRNMKQHCIVILLALHIGNLRFGKTYPGDFHEIVFILLWDLFQT